MNNVWFAWYPVFTEQKKWIWMQKVIRIYDDYLYLQVIDPYDLGEYIGGWRYNVK